MTNPSMQKLTIVVLTCNEAKHISHAIASALALNPAEVVVVDSGSEDTTVDLALQAGARVENLPWRGYVEQRNHSLSFCHTEWVLFLDADETLNPSIAISLNKVLCSAYNGADLKRHNYFLGQHIRCADEHVPRLLRVGAGRWQGGFVHERLNYDGPTQRINNAIEHAAWPDLATFFNKHQHYAKLMARTRFEKGQRVNPLHLFKPLWAIPKFLVLKGGLADGWRGIVYAMAYTIYSCQKILFQFELQETNAKSQKID